MNGRAAPADEQRLLQRPYKELFERIPVRWFGDALQPELHSCRIDGTVFPLRHDLPAPRPGWLGARRLDRDAWLLT